MYESQLRLQMPFRYGEDMANFTKKSSPNMTNLPQTKRDKMRLWLESNKDQVRRYTKVFHENHQELLQTYPSPTITPPSRLNETLIPPPPISIPRKMNNNPAVNNSKWIKGPDGRWLRSDDLGKSTVIPEKFHDDSTRPKPFLPSGIDENRPQIAPQPTSSQGPYKPLHYVQPARPLLPQAVNRAKPSDFNGINNNEPIVGRKPAIGKVKDKIKIIEELQRNIKLNPAVNRKPREPQVKRNEPWIYAQKRSRSNYGTLKDLLSTALHRTISLMNSSVDENSQRLYDPQPSKYVKDNEIDKNLATANRRKIFQDKNRQFEHLRMTMKNYLDLVPASDEFETEFSRRYSHLIDHNDEFGSDSFLNSNRKSKSLTSLARKYQKNDREFEFTTEQHESDMTLGQTGCDNSWINEAAEEHQEPVNPRDLQNTDVEEEGVVVDDGQQRNEDSFTARNNYEIYGDSDYNNQYYLVDNYENNGGFYDQAGSNVENYDELNNYYERDNEEDQDVVYTNDIGPDTNGEFEGQEVTEINDEYYHDDYQSGTYRILKN